MVPSARCTLNILIFALLAAVALPVGVKGQEQEASLPLKKVVMFNSGVGYFEHAAEVEGDARVELKFNVDDVNDLLKSLVLEDLGGGRISTVTYGSKDPLTKTLKTFAIDLTDNPTLAELLDQIRGERVQVEAVDSITGTIIGVEQRPQPSGGDGDPVEVDYLNLLTEEGLRSVSLDKVTRIKLVNRQLDAELQQALAVLAMGHSTDKKSVTLSFRGQGQRPVRVGYVQESPVWKTSYRLVLKDDESPFLQGWAIVENTTEEDWRDVALTLVSGRPISFIMDLYQPLYVSRPVVEQELYASLRPPKYDQDLAEKEEQFRALGRAGQPADAAKAAPPTAARNFMAPSRRGLAMDAQSAELQLQQGVQSAAQASDVGELFQYAIEAPVSLPRQQSAMLPIVNESVDGEKVSIYNQSVQAKHPLNGLKLSNTTGLHLMQGPITVFDGGAYAGDAQIEDLQPGAERLISYALDLDIEVAPRSQPRPEQLTSVSLVKGVLHITQRYDRSQEYVIKSSAKRAKKLLVEHPLDPAWELVSPKEPDEKTRDKYRFAVTAEPGKLQTLTVEEQRIVRQQVALTNLDSSVIVQYVNARVISQPVKEALQEVIRRKMQLAELAAQQKQLAQQVTVIEQEQARIRQNMQQLDRNTDLYNRYVKKFGEQEDEIERLRRESQQLSTEEARLRKSLDEFLAGLTLQ